MRLFPTTVCAMALSVSLSAAQTQSTPGSDSTAPPPPATAPLDPIAPGGHWNVADARCRALLGESDDDRAAIRVESIATLAQIEAKEKRKEKE